MLLVASCGRDESEPATGESLPARVADLAAEGEGVLETLRRRVDVASHEVDFGAVRLGIRQERRPPDRRHSCQRRVEHDPRIVELSAEKMQPSQHGPSKRRWAIGANDISALDRKV